jgi:hypothetical protein
MIVKMCFEDDRYERLVECDTLHKMITNSGEEMVLGMYKDGNLAEEPRFRIKDGGSGLCVGNISIYIMEKGKTVDNIRIRPANAKN